MDFTPNSLKYDYSLLSMTSGSSFSVNCIVRISLTDANDFLFAGKTQSLSDITKAILIFPTDYGYMMRAKTSD